MELLSDIGFIQTKITLRDAQRAARGATDGVVKITGTEVSSYLDEASYYRKNIQWL